MKKQSDDEAAIVQQLKKEAFRRFFIF